MAGQGAVTITYNDGGSDGDLRFFSGGKLDFWDLGSNLIINGNDFTLVRTLGGLKRAIKTNPSGFFGLVASYDAHKNGILGKPPISHFFGTLEGLGNTLSNLSIDNQHHSGIAFIGENFGTIRDIGLTAVNISGWNSAGLVSGNHGIIENSYVTGRVDGKYSAGGLVGANEPDVGGQGAGRISRSHSDATVTGATKGPDSAAGGLVAVNLSLVDFSYATGDVSSGVYMLADSLAPNMVKREWQQSGTATQPALRVGAL